MKQNLSKSQKAIIILSGIWTIISLLIAGGISTDSYTGFSLIAFLTVLLIVSIPVWLYWAGVWIWGFGYISRNVRKVISKTSQLPWDKAENEKLRLEYKYAGFWHRLGAAFLDISPVVGIVIIFGALGIYEAMNNTAQPLANNFWKGVSTIAVTIYGIYLMFAEGSKWQAAWGKRLCRIYVINKNTGTKIGYGRAFLRHVIKIFFVSLGTSIAGSGNIVAVLIGYLIAFADIGVAAFTKEKTALHDLLLSTRVIRGRPEQKDDEIETSFKDVITTKNYFVSHWRGELSLPISFWVNGLILNILIYIFIIAVLANIEIANSTILYSLAAIFVWLATLPVYVWQIVGGWRSANRWELKHYGKTRFVGVKFFCWASAAKYCFFAGIINTIILYCNTGIPQISEYWKIATGKDPIGTYQLRVIHDASELEISGMITFGLVSEVEKTLEAQPTIKIVHLNSLGGRIAEARKLRDLILKRGLSTYTATECSSACVIAFAAGKERLIDPEAKLGLHQYSFPGLNSADFAAQYAKDRTFLISQGIKPNFLEKAYSTPPDEMWNPSHKELYQSQMITRYPTDDEVGLSGISLTEIDKIDEGLVKLPLYAALKLHEPKIYQEIITFLKDSLLRGESMIALRKKTIPLIQSVYLKKLPYSSAPTLKKAVQLLLDEMAELYKVNPQLCYYYIFPDPKYNYTESLSQDILGRETDSMTEVISTANNNIKIISEKEFNALMSDVIIKLQEEYGNEAVTDLSLFDNQALAAKNKAKVCPVAHALYSTILKFPDYQSIPILRYMLRTK